MLTMQGNRIDYKATKWFIEMFSIPSPLRPLLIIAIQEKDDDTIISLVVRFVADVAV